jgi:hypothetical protein
MPSNDDSDVITNVGTAYLLQMFTLSVACNIQTMGYGGYCVAMLFIIATQVAYKEPPPPGYQIVN